MAETRIRAFAHSPNSQRKAKDAHYRALVARLKSEDHITKADMAQTANVSRATFLAWEKKPEYITLGALRRLKEAYGLTAEDLDKFI